MDSMYVQVTNKIMQRSDSSVAYPYITVCKYHAPKARIPHMIHEFINYSCCNFTDNPF